MPRPILTCVPPNLPDWLSTLITLAAALNGPGLLQSFVTRSPANRARTDFDGAHDNCAYVYDNALAGLALLASGHGALAAHIGAALLTAQSNDRFWQDGRLRNAYRSGPAPLSGPYPLPGFWSPKTNAWLEDGYQAGTATGAFAFAMLLWSGLAKAGFGDGFAKGAERAARFIAKNLLAPKGFYGGFIGFEPTPDKQLWVSTEHATDLAAAFANLDSPLKAHARDFVDFAFLPKEGRFLAGLKPDGTPNPFIAIDANLWPSLLPDPNPAWSQALPFVLKSCGVSESHDQIDGVDFNDDRDGIWLEGTAITALALGRANLSCPKARFLATLARHTVSGGIDATNIPRLTTGLSTGLDPNKADFYYYQRPALAPLAWAVLASKNINPYAVAF